MACAENFTADDSCPISPDSTRFRNLVKASGVAIAADLSLLGLKYGLSVLIGSPVLLADALHSGGDLAVSLVVLCSIIVHYQFKDNAWARHLEGVVALLISLLLIAGSIGIISRTLTNPSEGFRLARGIPLVIAIAGMGVVLGIIFAMSCFKQRVGEQYASIAFIAESMHTQSDFFTSVGVWSTLVLAYFNVHLERLMTLLVGVVVLQIGVRLFFRAVTTFRIRTLLSRAIRRLPPIGVRQRCALVWQPIHRLIQRLTPRCSRSMLIDPAWLMRHRFHVAWGYLLTIALLYIGTGIYSVAPYQTGLELFFGKVAEQNPPGLHVHAPRPFGDVVLVDTAVETRIESGFRTNQNFYGEEPVAYLWEFSHTEGRYTKVPEEAITLTGDETLIDANFLCYYRIVDPVQYALQTKNAHEILRSLFIHKVHTELRQYRLDDLLTSQRQEIQMALCQTMRQAVDTFSLGVEILNVYMREAHPPVEVVPSYRAVGSARENKIEIIHTANTYANAILPLSRGQADTVLAQAAGDAVERISAASEETQDFLLKQETFRQTEPVQRIRLWWNAVEVALRNKALYIFPKKTPHRVYSSGTASAKQPGSNLFPRNQEDENYYGPEEHPVFDPTKTP